MKGNNQVEKKIIDILASKSCLKQKVYDFTVETFGQLKNVLQEITEDINNKLIETDERVRLETSPPRWLMPCTSDCFK